MKCTRVFLGARFAMKKMLKMSKLEDLPRKFSQNDVTRVKHFIMTVKSLLEVQAPITGNLVFTNIILYIGHS